MNIFFARTVSLIVTELFQMAQLRLTWKWMKFAPKSWWAIFAYGTESSTRSALCSDSQRGWCGTKSATIPVYSNDMLSLAPKLYMYFSFVFVLRRLSIVIAHNLIMLHVVVCCLFCVQQWGEPRAASDGNRSDVSERTKANDVLRAVRSRLRWDARRSRGCAVTGPW